MTIMWLQSANFVLLHGFTLFFLQKRMRIKKLPTILALHLKRFKYMEQYNRHIKVSHRVVFPLELRLFNTVSKPYCKVIDSKQGRRKLPKAGWASSNVEDNLPPLVDIGLTDLPEPGWAIAHSVHHLLRSRFLPKYKQWGEVVIEKF